MLTFFKNSVNLNLHFKIWQNLIKTSENIILKILQNKLHIKQCNLSKKMFRKTVETR